MPTAEQRFVSFPNKYGPYVEPAKGSLFLRGENTMAVIASQ